ncbi:MAG: mucoidy inhibitor MuiA family protein [Desulfuromonadales bacterium]|nr:mucoidy inhibitor MuiA family protein [Desulfuromonadales bacterium]
MSNLRCLAFFAFLLLPSISASSDLKRLAPTAHITAVTVYADRALTSRSTVLNLKPGTYLIVFENLPTLLQDDSVQVKGKGTAMATIAGLEIKRSFLAQSGEKRAQELDDQIRELERRTGSLDAKKAGLASQKSFIESIRVAWGDRISKELAIGRPTSAELLEATGFVGAQVTRTEEQSRDLETEKKNLADKIDALRRQHDEITGSQRKETKSVEVLVEITREGQLTLELATVIPQASWTPAYDVRLAPDATTAELTFRAIVRQQTGEDWSNVDLTLSTARPAGGGAPPELNPWRISFFRPQPARGSLLLGAAPASPAPRMAMKAGSGLDGNSMREEAMAEETPMAFEIARTSDEQSSIAFHISRPLDIPSDNSQHASVVAIEKFPVNMEYQTVPKLSPAVFLKSEITNRASYPLLPGKVSTFVGTTFTGSSHLKKIASGDKFDLFFGSDDQVTIKREELKQHKEAGMFGSNRVSYRYLVSVANFHNQPLTVTLLDQLPLAGDEEIKVSLEEATQKPDLVKNDGSIAWKMPLKAGEKKELGFGILVEYPKDREITGI